MAYITLEVSDESDVEAIMDVIRAAGIVVDENEIDYIEDAVFTPVVNIHADRNVLESIAIAFGVDDDLITD